MNKISAKTIFYLVIILGLFIYFLYQGRGFIFGSRIIIGSPKNGEIFHESYVRIKGNVLNVSNLSLNGRKIFTNENGDFDEGLLLAKGYNIIEITAVDKFNRSKKEEREVVLE